MDQRQARRIAPAMSARPARAAGRRRAPFEMMARIGYAVPGVVFLISQVSAAQPAWLRI